MAKLIAPAQITKVNELLELLTDPSRFAKYLLELKQLQDAIEQKLDIVSTKEAADAMQAEASRLLSEAKNNLSVAEDEANRLGELSLAKLAEAETSLDRAKRQIDQQFTALRDKEQIIDGERQALDNLRSELKDLSVSLAAKARSLNEREQALNNQAETLQRRLELLSSPI